MRSPDDQEVVRTRSIGVVDVLGEPEARKTTTTTRSVSTSVQVINGTKLETQRF
jgi:hypothetical protein